MPDQEHVLAILAEATRLSTDDLDSRWSLLDRGVTSFRIMQAIMKVEETYNLEFSDDELVRFPVLPTEELLQILYRHISEGK